MPKILKLKSYVVNLISSFIPAMFLVCKFHEFKRQQQEQNKRKITERELSNLNHKIDKLLIKLEEHEPELASSPDDECVICISAKATMQTFPCGHRVVCRKCFVKTIQVAVSQRLLPLRCVICRAKILRLKQTTHGGIDTGTVLRSRGGSSSSASGSSHSSSSSTYHTSNPFYLSPASSPVSPVTEVFREQRAVWVRNYDSFALGNAVKSPSITPTTATPVVSPITPGTSPDGLPKRENCVLHNHCSGKSKSRNGSKSKDVSPVSEMTSSLSQSPCSSTAMVNVQKSKGMVPCSPSVKSLSSKAPKTSTPTTATAAAATLTSSHRMTTNPWQWQFNSKKHHRLAHRRRHGGHFGTGGRPNSLLLPIDERDEWTAADAHADTASGRT